MTTRQQLLAASVADVFGGDPSKFSVKSDLRIWSQNGKAVGYLDVNGEWNWLIYNDSTTLGGPNPQPNYTAVMVSPPMYVGTAEAAVNALRFVVEEFVPAMTIVHWEARWGTDLQMSVATPYINAIVPGSAGPYVVDSLSCPNVLVNWTSTDPTNLHISCVNSQGQTQPAGTPLTAQLVGITGATAGSAVAQPLSGSTSGTQSGGGTGSGPPQQGQTQRLYTPIPYNSYPPRTHSAYNALRRMTIDHSNGKMYGVGDTYWQWQEWIQQGSIPGQEPDEDGLWTVPADIDAFNPDSRQATLIDELNSSFYDSLVSKDLAKLAYDDSQGKLYGMLPNGSVPGVNFPRLVEIGISTATVVDRGNVTNPNTTIPNLQITFSDIFYDYHNDELMVVCWEQYTKVTDYYTLNGQQVTAGLQQRAVFRNAIHIISRQTGVNPLTRKWTSKEVVLPDAPKTLADAGYYKIVSVANSSQGGKMYAVAMKPFAETDTTKPDRWLVALDINVQASDSEIAPISADSINSINYNPINNRLYGVLYNGWSTAEIEKSDVGFDAVTIPPPSSPTAGGGGGTSGGTGGGGSPTPLLMISTSTLPNAIENSDYAAGLTAVNGTGPYTWSVIAGSLPPGFALGGSTSLNETLAATAPLTPGTYTFTIQVQDSLGAKAHVPYTLVVAPSTGATGSVRVQGALIVDVLNSGAVNDVVYTRLNSINQNVWSAYDFLVITVMSSRAGQLVEIEFGDLLGPSQLLITQRSSLSSIQAQTQQQAITQAKLQQSRATGSLGLATGVGRQPSYNRVLVDFQQANQTQDVLIPIDSSRFPAGSSLSHIGFKVVDASQPFAFAVTRIELQKTLSTTAQGFLTQTEAFLKAFGIAAPFSVNDYRAMAKFIQYRVTLTTQVPPISPKIIDKTDHEINAATVYNHPLSRLKRGKRRTPYASIDDGTNPYEMQNLYYSQAPIAVPGGYIEDGFALEPSKEPIVDPKLYYGVGGKEFDLGSPFPIPPHPAIGTGGTWFDVDTTLIWDDQAATDPAELTEGEAIKRVDYNEAGGAGSYIYDLNYLLYSPVTHAGPNGHAAIYITSESISPAAGAYNSSDVLLQASGEFSGREFGRVMVIKRLSTTNNISIMNIGLNAPVNSRTSGGDKVNAYGFVSGFVTVDSLAWTNGTYAVVAWRWNESTTELEVSVNGGAWQATSGGNNTWSPDTGNIQMGRGNYACLFDWWFDGDPDGITGHADFDAFIAQVKSWYGIT